MLVLIILSSTPNMPIQDPCCEKTSFSSNLLAALLRLCQKLSFWLSYEPHCGGITDTLIRIILWLTCLYQYFYLSLFQPRNTYSFWTPVISFPEELMLWCLSSIISIDFALNLFFCMQHVPTYWVCLLSVPSFAWWSLKFTDLFCCWYNC